MRLGKLLWASPLLVAISLTTANGAFIVDFGVNTATDASPVAAGATNGNTVNNPIVPGDPYPVPEPLTVVNLSGIATGFGNASVHGTVLMSSGEIPNNTFRAINRNPGAKTAAQNPGLNNNTANDDFLRDWISVTQFTTTTEGVITLNPSPTLSFAVSGLDPGKYIWTSWHHDVDDQTGLINYTFTDALGASSGVIDASHGVANTNNTGSPANFVNGRGPVVNGTGDPMNNPPGTPTAFTHMFTVDGSGSFTFEMTSGFDPNLPNDLPYTSSSMNFVLINGFEVTRIPEPSSICLLGTVAAIGLLLARNRKK